MVHRRRRIHGAHDRSPFQAIRSPSTSFGPSCDCEGVAAEPVVTPNIGIVASRDILAVIRASVDLVYALNEHDHHALVAHGGRPAAHLHERAGDGNDRYQGCKWRTTCVKEAVKDPFHANKKFMLNKNKGSGSTVVRWTTRMAELAVKKHPFFDIGKAFFYEKRKYSGIPRNCMDRKSRYYFETRKPWTKKPGHAWKASGGRPVLVHQMIRLLEKS